MSDIWGLRCRMFRGSYGRSCMRLVPVDLSYFWTPAYIASLSVTSCPLCTSIFIPTMKYKSIFHHPILSHHSHSHPFQSSSKNIFITMSDSSSSSTLKSTIDQSSKSSPFPLGHSLRNLKPELWHSWLEFVHSVRIGTCNVVKNTISIIAVSEEQTWDSETKQTFVIPVHGIQTSRVTQQSEPWLWLSFEPYKLPLLASYLAKGSVRPIISSTRSA